MRNLRVILLIMKITKKTIFIEFMSNQPEEVILNYIDMSGVLEDEN